MGDILHALPAVTALRLAHPAWEIDWIVEPRWRALLATSKAPAAVPEQPIVDRIYLAATKEWRHHPLARKTTQEIKALRDRLKAAPYNAVHRYAGRRCARRFWGAWPAVIRLIGEDTPREGRRVGLYTERIATHGAHVIEQDIELASAVAGDPLTLFSLCFPLTPLPNAGAMRCLPPAERGPWRCSIPARDGAPSAGRSSAMPRLPAV